MNRIQILSVVLVALFSFTNNVFAAPNPTVISGMLVEGSAITIAGSGFGTKETAAPWVWDDFENGTNGAELTTSPSVAWQRYDGTSTYGDFPSYSATAAYSGLLGAKKTTSRTAEFRSHGVNGLNSDEMYYSIMFKWTKDTGSYLPSGHVMKLTRLNAGAFYGSVPSVWVTMNPRTGYMYADGNNGTGVLVGSDVMLVNSWSTFNEGNWHRIEVYWKMSTPGVADGKVRHFVDNIERAVGTWDPVMTRSASYPNAKASNFLLPMMGDLFSTLTLSFYADDVYVDRTQARVEICDSSTFSARSHCEIQIPSSWSDTSITFNARKGTFSDFSGNYLYVFDKDGNVNANGHLLTSVNPDTTPPSAPTGLVVN